MTSRKRPSGKGRVPPTPEDAAIFRRNMERIFRWNAETPTADPFGRDLLAIANACGDYMEQAR